MEKHKINILHYENHESILLLGEFHGKLCLCDWKNRTDRERLDRRLQTVLKAKYVEERTPLLDETVRQLDAYFLGKRQQFDLPLLTVGTLFQKSVWDVVSSIPYGHTLSYKTLASKIGRPEAVRAVATAVGANALSLCIPCHRVVGNDGTLRGYAGGLETKKSLLEMEGALC